MSGKCQHQTNRYCFRRVIVTEIADLERRQVFAHFERPVVGLTRLLDQIIQRRGSTYLFEFDHAILKQLNSPEDKQR
jgi:hypothetical protein